MKRPLIAAAVLVTLILLAWWLRPSGSSPTISPQDSTSMSADSKQYSDAPLDRVAQSSIMRPERGHGPDESAEQGVADELYCLNRSIELTCFNRAQGMGPLVRSSLADLDQEEFHAAIVIWNLLGFCRRAPRTEAELLMVILDGFPLHKSHYRAFGDSELAQSGYAGDDPPYPVSASLLPIDFASSHCLPIHALVDGGFRKRVAERAARGNEAYQLLFTLWAPEHDVPFDERLAWQLQSLDYSERSIQRGSAMGLLAFSWSYLGGRYTPFQVFYSVVYGKAAILCSVDPRLLPGVVHEVEPDNVANFVHGLFSGDALTHWPEELARNCL